MSESDSDSKWNVLSVSSSDSVLSVSSSDSEPITSGWMGVGDHTPRNTFKCCVKFFDGLFADILEQKRNSRIMQHLKEMEFRLPPHHVKARVIFRGDSPNPIDFDPTKLPPERRFIKTCCYAASSADTCGCHVGTTHKSVRYVNSMGETIIVFYHETNTEYFNLAYYMWDKSCENERVVEQSPESDVSASDVYPFPIDSEFEIQVKKAYTAIQTGEPYKWKNKKFESRFKRRQRKIKQRETGELPMYKLILVNLDTHDIREKNRHNEELCHRVIMEYNAICQAICNMTPEDTLASI